MNKTQITSSTEASTGDGLERLMARAGYLGSIRVAVVHPCDVLSLSGALDARSAGLIEPVLVAPKARLLALAGEAGLDLTGIPIEDVPHSHAADSGFCRRPAHQTPFQSLLRDANSGLSAPGSAVVIGVEPTNEEWVVANQARALLCR